MDFEFSETPITWRDVVVELVTLVVTIAAVALYAAGFTLGLRLWGMS